MVKVTSDEKAFFENNNEPLFIYGCTTLGKHMGLLLDRCKIGFISYIDRNTKARGGEFFGHSIINKSQLDNIDSPVYNIIVTVQDTHSVMLDFCNMDQTKMYNLFLPKKLANGKINGNLMLAPLRYRLINNKK